MAAKLVAVGKRVGEKLVPVGIRLVYSSVAKGQSKMLNKRIICIVVPQIVVLIHILSIFSPRSNTWIPNTFSI